MPALMYADDIVLMTTTPHDVQHLVDATYEFCTSKRMQISAEKTAVVLFKAARRQDATPHVWPCSGRPLQQKDAKKYLGLPFTSSHGVAGAMSELCRRQNTACGLLRRRYFELRCHCAVALMLKLH